MLVHYTASNSCLPTQSIGIDLKHSFHAIVSQLVTVDEIVHYNTMIKRPANQLHDCMLSTTQL